VETSHIRDTGRRLRFGAFQVDLQSREVTHEGARVKLQDKPFQILELLLAEPGKLVTREEVRRKLWPADTFVDFEAGLNTAMRKLRDALQDDAKTPQFVQTVQRHGYRFIAPIETIQPVGSAADGASTTRTENRSGQRERDGARHRHFRTRYVPVLAGVALTAVPVLLLTLNVGDLRHRLLGRTAPRHIRSLVVLPLENLSGDPAQEYFADGMTEALITNLGKIGRLRVISRTSAMHYKGAHKKMSEIANELNVDAAVEGAVLRSGGRVRITAQLVEASSDRHLWAQAYERDLQDVLLLQDELAQTIAKQVQIKLSLEEQTRLATARRIDAEALEAYLQGREQWNKWTEEGVRKSIEYFEQAVHKDSADAQAWAGISDAYNLLYMFGYSPSEEALPKAKTAALRALELDNSLSEAHVSLACVMRFEWTAKEKEYQRAIELNPNNAMAHQYYGYNLSALGRFDEAIAEMKRALELDPLTPNKQNSLGATFYRAGRYDEALEQFREVPDPDANSESRHQRMAAIYERRAQQREAVNELRIALTLAGEKELATSVEQKFNSSGYWPARETFLWGDLREKQKRAKKGQPALALAIAGDHAALGEKDRAFAWLEKSFQEREGGLMYLNVDDRFAALRSDPRFQNLVHLIGLG
jgi:TolB-like protein/DNA-binding winged helix-turn-helix (wHTH) protein